MNFPFIQKIKSLTRRISFKTSVYLALAAVAILAITGLVIDIWAFYIYGYNAVNEDVTSEYTITLKRKELTGIINILDARKDKFNTALEGNMENVPPLFR
ncbi:MAG: hypothetical protein A2934_04235 [Candidatus Sungbacteria bacterium RIFCSPLOWO2_01_FULL_47_10]|uniref:Uncharacterized protein n=1 Tax=Candidatus Sungbacteria bacterium RIFCSPLOWO2_01_FULL_47_10 TaxID=1802276 RepID=A0A1G2KZQ6_9BACT|nr:MAG: hypothetical protein A2934_04235 [Candidatus Sungbacteria bacterium RIFCSPLOWO2_01_FULL_47_10]